MHKLIELHSDAPTVIVEILLDILARTFRIYLGITAGFLFMRTPLARYRRQFVSLVISIFTPMLVIISILTTDISAGLTIPIIVSLFVTFGGYMVIYLLNGGKPDDAETNVAIFPNALNFPFPLIFALAPESLGVAGIFLITQIVLRNTFGMWTSNVSVTRDEIVNIIKFPPLIAVFLGFVGRFFLGEESLSAVVVSPATSFLLELGIFLTIMTIGFGIKRPSTEFVGAYLRVGTTRFLVIPLLGIIALIVLDVEMFIFIPLAIQVFAPPAVYNGIYAEKFELDTELTANVILVLTLVGVLLIPLEFWLLSSLIS